MRALPHLLSLDLVERFEPLAQSLGVSEVARSDRGFLTAYRQAGGEWSALPAEWQQRRNNFVKRHVAQVTENDEPIFDEDGQPTRRHLALIMWAHSPMKPAMLAATLEKLMARTNPPLPEHMANDDLAEIADGLAARFVDDVASGRVKGFLEFATFVRHLCKGVFDSVEARADTSLSDDRQAVLSDLGEVAMRVNRLVFESAMSVSRHAFSAPRQNPSPLPMADVSSLVTHLRIPREWTTRFMQGVQVEWEEHGDTLDLVSIGNLVVDHLTENRDYYRTPRENPAWARTLGHVGYRGARYAAEVGKDVFAGAKQAHGERRARKNPSALLLLNPSLSPCARSYLETAIWSSLNDEGKSLEYLNYDVSDFSPEAIAAAEKDCQSFLSSCETTLSDEEVGHNFWLTRNRHGEGFWAKGLGREGDELTKLAHAYGTCDVYIGDDEKLHLS